MRDVVDPSLDEIWTNASQEALDRTTGLARRGLRARLSVLSSFDAGTRSLRSVDGGSGDLPPDALCAKVSEVAVPVAQAGGPGTPPGHSYLGVPIILASGRAIGTLCVIGESGREWPADDVDFLQGVAATLGDHIDLETRLGRSPKSKTSPPSETASATSRVLIADDLDLNRKLIADMLSIDGHAVDCVEDGVEAVKAARANVYDLIFMDMIMPRMDGLAAARAIRDLPAPAGEVPIIALTANCGADQLESCIAAGMNATLVKPMTFDSLSDVVSTWVRQKRSAA